MSTRKAECVYCLHSSARRLPPQAFAAHHRRRHPGKQFSQQLFSLVPRSPKQSDNFLQRLAADVLNMEGLLPLSCAATVLFRDAVVESQRTVKEQWDVTKHVGITIDTTRTAFSLSSSLLLHQKRNSIIFCFCQIHSPLVVVFAPEAGGQGSIPSLV